MGKDDVVAIRPAGPCPICGRPTRPEHRPFCSARCRDIDLSRWLSGGYVIPGEALEEEDIPETGSPENDHD